MSEKDDAHGWAGGQEQDAAKAELERLRKLGDGLRDLTAAAARIRDPDALAAIQDRNLEAFETMTGDMGLAALDRMLEAAAVLADPKTAQAASDLAARGEASVAAAQAEIEAARDQARAGLLRDMEARLRAAGQSRSASSAPADDFEPFEGGALEDMPTEAEPSAEPSAPEGDRQ